MVRAGGRWEGRDYLLEGGPVEEEEEGADQGEEVADVGVAVVVAHVIRVEALVGQHGVAGQAEVGTCGQHGEGSVTMMILVHEKASCVDEGPRGVRAPVRVSFSIGAKGKGASTHNSPRYTWSPSYMSCRSLTEDVDDDATTRIAALEGLR